MKKRPTTKIRDAVVRAAERRLDDSARRFADLALRIERLRADDPKVIALARDVLESDEGAACWLLEPTHTLAGLGGKAPVDLLDTAKGREAVRQLLRKIEYNIPP